MRRMRPSAHGAMDRIRRLAPVRASIWRIPRRLNRTCRKVECVRSHGRLTQPSNGNCEVLGDNGASYDGHDIAFGDEEGLAWADECETKWAASGVASRGASRGR